MKQWTRITGLFTVLAAVVTATGQIGSAAALPAPTSHSAQSALVTQELHITAIVPKHRDIIIDSSGNITKIISNTTDDVTPDVYVFDTTPANQRPLTSQLYAQYRQLVPAGTARYGALYERTLPPILGSILNNPAKAVK